MPMVMKGVDPAGVCPARSRWAKGTSAKDATVVMREALPVLLPPQDRDHLIAHPLGLGMGFSDIAHLPPVHGREDVVAVLGQGTSAGDLLFGAVQIHQQDRPRL